MVKFNRFSLKSSQVLSVGFFYAYGLYLGVASGTWRPILSPYMVGVRNGLTIFSANKVVLVFRRFLSFLEKIVPKGRVLLASLNVVHSPFVLQLMGKLRRQIFKKYSIRMHATFLGKWIGGSLTNFHKVKNKWKQRGLKTISQMRDRSMDLINVPLSQKLLPSRFPIGVVFSGLDNIKAPLL